jgi:hypothetical protein
VARLQALLHPLRERVLAAPGAAGGRGAGGAEPAAAPEAIGVADDASALLPLLNVAGELCGRRVDGRLDGWTDGRKDGQTDGRADGQAADQAYLGMIPGAAWLVGVQTDSFSRPGAATVCS